MSVPCFRSFHSFAKTGIRRGRDFRLRHGLGAQMPANSAAPDASSPPQSLPAHFFVPQQTPACVISRPAINACPHHFPVPPQTPARIISRTGVLQFKLCSITCSSSPLPRTGRSDRLRPGLCRRGRIRRGRSRPRSYARGQVLHSRQSHCLPVL